jgi:DNA-binding FrmR family transcriptional regulator
VITSITQLNEHTRDDILQRLKSIEGQARGIARMVEDGRSCQDVMDQMTALRSATHALSLQLLEEFALHCLRNASDFPTYEQAVTEMVRVLSRLAR